MQIDSARIVLVDDEPHVRNFIKLTLRELGVQIVAEAGNGEEAVAAFRQYRPDLVLLDIMMPGTTGPEALEAIMADDPDARVIMLTSISDSESVNRCLDIGAWDYLLKDGAVEEIRGAVRQALAETD